jgi:hypothetical protein
MANAERQTEQQAPTPAEPTEEHRWLQRLEGTWDIEGEADMGNGEVSKWTAVETVRKVGELWVVAESIGEMPGGGPATNLTTLGYDPRTSRFVGTFVSTMMTYLWIYEGKLDDRKKALTFTARRSGHERGRQAREVRGRLRIRERHAPHVDLAHAGPRREVEAVHGGAVPAEVAPAARTCGGRR